MKKNLWISLSLSAVCMAGLSARAQTSSATTTTTMKPATTAATTTAAKPAVKPATAAATSTAKLAAPAKAEEAPKLSYNMTLEASFTTNAEADRNGVREQAFEYMFNPSVGYGNYTMILFEFYDQDFNDSQSASFSDPNFILSRKAIELGKYFKLGPSASLILPMSDSSKNDVGLIYNLGGALKLSLNTKALGADNWSLAYSTAYNRNFTSYDTNGKTGQPNSMQRLRQRVEVGYKFTDKFSIFNRFQYDSNYSVNGIVSNSFVMFESLGYDINDNWSVSFTHTNSGKVLKPVTYENNLKFYDPASSEYSVAVDLNL